MKKTLIICLALAFAALFSTQFASNAQAQATFTCTHMIDADSAWVVYTLAGGEAGTYTITCTASGRITVVGTCNDLTGPDDTDSIKVECNGEGRGSLQIVCEKDAAVVGSCDFCVTNDASGNMKEIPCWAGPTMTEWGLVVFAGLFIALLIFVIRKRARVPTPA